MNFIHDYFHDLDSKQLKQLESLFKIYKDWNSRINVISRKDMDYFYLHHVLHSLSIAKFIEFKAGTKILDVGTGGGFPGVPLAIVFPEVHFYLADSIGKKIKVINDVKDKLGLDNISTYYDRVENLEFKVDFVVCRAVAPIETLMNWSADRISDQQNHSIRNGFLCLKGGDLSDELSKYKNAQVLPLKEYFGEAFFETKKLVYCPLD
ncbi:MAG: 16S rRNA (guanine(527)-N(7))-methyltransferase RsmG [Bacteroidetes bacterium]|nr:16S rRNA (guanine(527)-N(7))-methyltransferase RsmG [Bacteroidota bacterium]